MFHPDYNSLVDKLPKSLVNRSYQRLLTHSHHPIPQDQIDKKNKRIETYLLRTLEVYQNSLNQKHKKKTQTIEPLVNLSNTYNIDMKNKDTVSSGYKNHVCPTMFFHC